MVKAKKKKASARTPTEKKVRGVRGKSGLTVCQTWLRCFETKSIKTAAQCSAKMHAEFPNRASKIFDFPQVVINRANKGLLDGQKHKFAKYAS